MSLPADLQQLGLSETESKIYLGLLHLKSATAVALAKEIHVHRRTIYDNLALLLHKGLASYVLINNVKYYQSTKPENLSIFLEESEKTLARILPQITSIYKTEKQKSSVNIFLGISGAKTVIAEALNCKGTLYWMGGGLHLLRALAYSRQFIEQKLKTLDLRVIQPNIDEIQTLLPYIQTKNIRLLPKTFVVPVGYLTYENTVIIGIINDQHITTIHIESVDCAKAFRNYFTLLFSIAKPLKKK